jgi:hypothetical protein
MNDSSSDVPDYLLVKDRPLGISILSVLSILGGVAMTLKLIGATFFWDSAGPNIKKAAESAGAPLLVLIGSVVTLAALAIEAGVGMWLGRAWGWWLGSFWHLLAIVRNANAFYMAMALAYSMPPAEAAAIPGGVQKYFVRFGLRIGVSVLIYIYFFGANVREYFGLANAKLWRAVAMQIAICLALVVGISGICSRLLK